MQAPLVFIRKDLDVLKILISGVLIFIGYILGIRSKLRKIEKKKQEIKDLMDKIKQMNNDMLSNFSKVAHAASNTEGKWTEIDEFLLPMWME